MFARQVGDMAFFILGAVHDYILSITINIQYFSNGKLGYYKLCFS